MKLTDEQREIWNSYVEWAKTNQIRQVSVDTEALESLLSSEQAWKEECEQHEAIAKRKLEIKQNAVDEAMTENMRLKEQLNQAVERLERLLEYNMLHTGEDAREARVAIQSILSSLGKENDSD